MSFFSTTLVDTMKEHLMKFSLFLQYIQTRNDYVILPNGYCVRNLCEFRYWILQTVYIYLTKGPDRECVVHVCGF